MLDSWAMLAYLDGEPAAQMVRQVLRSARRGSSVVLFSIINYGECLYIAERERGLQAAQRAVATIDQLAVQVVPADRQLVFEAAHTKARYPISYADAFCAALAMRHHGHIMTGDPEFRAIEGAIRVRWLPDRRAAARERRG